VEHKLDVHWEKDFLQSLAWCV